MLDYYGLMTPSKRPRLPAFLLALSLSGTAAWAQPAPPNNSALSSSLMYELMLAEFSAQGGDPGSAFQLMLNAAQKTRSAQLFERAVEIALRARAGDSALQAAQAWARALPGSKDAARYVLQILIGLNKLPETVDAIKRQLSATPVAERAAVISQLPRYYVRTTDKKLAAKVVEQAIGAETGNAQTGPAAHAAIGTLRLLAGDATGALESATKGLALNPSAEEPAQLALSLIDPALPAAEALVVRHLSASTRPELRMGFVRKLLDAQRYQEALVQTRIITTTAPDYADAWLILGSLVMQERNPDEARKALQTFIRLHKTAESDSETPQEKSVTHAYFLLADIAEFSRQPDEARRYLSLIDSPQENLRVQIRLATLLARQGQLEEARALIRKAPELQPGDARAKISAEVQLLRDHKQHQAVYDLLKQTLETTPADPDFQYDLAMAAEKLDRLDEMESLLKQVITTKPDFHHAYNALGYSLADRKLRLEEARKLIQKALELAPNDPFILDSLGWVEYRSGNLAQSLQILQGAYQSRPDAEIAAHLGEVLWVMQQRKEARAIWEDGLAQNPDNDTLNETIKRLSTP